LTAEFDLIEAARLGSGVASGMINNAVNSSGGNMWQ
jgi:hypothetical protein